MDDRSFQQATTMLSREYSLSILRAMGDGEWHLSSEIAESLDIHISTASRFLQHIAELGIVERRQHGARTSEYRVRSPRLQLEVDLRGDSGPLLEAVDFYVTYFDSLSRRVRELGLTGLEDELKQALESKQEELRSLVFGRVVEGVGRGLQAVRQLMAVLRGELWDVCSRRLGEAAARKIFEAALREAIDAQPDLAARWGLVPPLEV